MNISRLRSLLMLAALVLAGFLGTQSLQSWRSDRLGRQIAVTAQTVDIHMVSSATCPYCDRARAWFTRYGVRFSECFIEKDEGCAAQFRALMAPGTPVLVVRGKRLVGFSPDRVAEALAQ